MGGVTSDVGAIVDVITAVGTGVSVIVGVGVGVISSSKYCPKSAVQNQLVLLFAFTLAIPIVLATALSICSLCPIVDASQMSNALFPVDKA